MEDEHTNGKKLARSGHNTVIYKGTFVSNHSLGTCKSIKEQPRTHKKKQKQVRVLLTLYSKYTMADFFYNLRLNFMNGCNVSQATMIRYYSTKRTKISSLSLDSMTLVITLMDEEGLFSFIWIETNTRTS